MTGRRIGRLTSGFELLNLSKLSWVRCESTLAARDRPCPLPPSNHGRSGNHGLANTDERHHPAGEHERGHDDQRALVPRNIQGRPDDRARHGDGDQAGDPGNSIVDRRADAGLLGMD